jgi:hypothetical protein
MLASKIINRVIQMSLCTHVPWVVHVTYVWHVKVRPSPPSTFNHLCHIATINKFTMRNIFVFLHVHRDFSITLYVVFCIYENKINVRC